MMPAESMSTTQLANPAETARRCNKSNRAARKAAAGSFWRLVAAGEPFRLLFPLGTLIGIYGVLMWPLFIWNVTGTYPGQIHARIMIEGFLTSFVIGFLGTALPRLLEVPKMTWMETLGFAVAVIGTVILHACGATMWGDQLFFFTICTLLFLLGTRALLFRKDNPPPAFVLVAVGMLCALFGSGVQVVSSVSATALPEWCFPLSKLLLYQGFLLFPIMGIGAFLLPRFFGLPNRQSFPESLVLSPEWKRGAVFALLCGGMVMAGFVMEAQGDPHWGNGLRSAGILIYFLREVPVHQAGFGGGSLALGLRLALLSIPSAYALMAIWPEQTFSLLHLLLITGFSLLTFIVASRVVLGHSGQSARFRATIWPVLIMTSLVALAMLTRVSADWMPAMRMSHYGYAAVSWVLGVVIWAVAILPGVRRADEE
ncbi:MAG: hypothetical protein BGO12_01645 [Verrucomicrobia bacterium 61-8]|nr:MAG: hypothetical protein BGO12_01645 [Verrucomicrobia bacterium 61-8]TXI07369.1 MAG: hypothetical protein E6Q76_08630 [Rhizobium sp.]